MNLLKAVFCCTCCAAVDPDDEYKIMTGFVDDHFLNEKNDLLKKRRYEDRIAIKSIKS